MIPKDEMNPVERAQAIAAGKPYDRIPFAPFLGDTAAHMVGTTMSKYHHSADIMVETELAVYEKYGQDGIGVGPGYKGFAEAFGTKFKYPEDNTPYVEKPVINDWSDLDPLTPLDPNKGEILPRFLEALKNLVDKLGKETPVGTFVGGPFSVAAFMRGTDDLLRDLRNNPDNVHRLMQLITDSVFLYIDAAADIGCNISIADPVASGTMISATVFRDFIKPYLKQYSDRVVEKTGHGPMLHICGNTTRIWQDMVETGASVLSLDNVVDMGKAKEEVGNNACLMGNVDPVTVIAKGTKEDIYNAVRNCLKQASDNPGGFILASGCQIPLDAPEENVQHFADAARIYGKYPIDKNNL